MDSHFLFDHYRKTASTPLPRDMKQLEGLFVIRRIHGNPRPVQGEISMSAVSRQQFKVRPLGDDREAEWVAFSALQTDVILLHASGDMHAIYSMLSRNLEWNAEAEQAQSGQKGAA
jgi:hypothetical protein